MDDQPAALPPSLAALAKVRAGDMEQPHVGNFAAVLKMMMGLLDGDYAACMAHAVGAIPWEEANGRTVAHIERLAAAFLGRDPAVAHVPGWNAPGGIDAHLRACLPDLAEGPPEKVVSDVLARLVLIYRNLMDAEEAVVIETTAKAAVLDAARMLTGLRPSFQGGGA